MYAAMASRARILSRTRNQQSERRAELEGLLRKAATQLALMDAESDDGPTFGDLAKSWLSTEQRRLVEPENVRRHLDHLKPLWGMTEKELSPRVARRVLYELLQPEGPLSAVTVNKVLSTARRLIRHAQLEEQWGGLNPFEVIDRLKEKKPKACVLSLEELRAVLPHLRPDRRREALVMAVLGPRPGELKALRKEDVDLKRRLVTWQRSNARDTTKTGRVRVVPIPDELVDAFRVAIAESPSELVFPDGEGNRQRADAKLSRTLRSALGAADIADRYDYSCRRKGCGFRDSLKRRPEKALHCPACGMKLWCHPVGRPMRWYDLRHCAATLHREAGCDPLVIQLVLGHAARNTTDAHYTHVSDDYMMKELNRLVVLRKCSACVTPGGNTNSATETAPQDGNPSERP